MTVLSCALVAPSNSDQWNVTGTVGFQWTGSSVVPRISLTFPLISFAIVFNSAVSAEKWLEF